MATLSGSDTWEDLQSRYLAYVTRPTWNHWEHPPDVHGAISRRGLSHMRKKGEDSAERLREAIRRLDGNNASRFPKTPREFRQREMNWILRARVLPQRLLPTFWRALIFDRAGYTCKYCGRSDTSIWEESNGQRTLGLTVEHPEPRARGGRTYSLENSAAACWSCNGVKSTLPAKVLDQELKSLARAINRGDLR